MLELQDDPAGANASGTGFEADSVSYLLDQSFHRLSYKVHGAQNMRTVLCVHGLTRVGADFDALAESLSDHFRVVSVDLPGRGRSAWLPKPEQYEVGTYALALSHLMSALGGTLDIIGTSLGGICGMALAAMPGHGIGRLVLNDVGPYVPAVAMQRLRDYLVQPPPRFADVGMLKTYLRRVHAPFGPLTDDQWLKLAGDSARPLPDGSVALHYDPAIAAAWAANPVAALDMWPWWNAIDIPMLALRGEWSDLLDPETAEAMRAKALVHTVENAGHAPALLDAPTIGVIRDFLLAGR